jgi:hypothetical protein
MYSATRDDFLDGLNKSILNQSDTSDFNYYRTIGYIAYFKCEYYHAIKYWLHFIRLINGKDTPSVDDFHFINSTMALAGFPEEGRKIADLALKQTGDRLWYHYAMLPITAGMGDGEHFNRLVMELHQEFPEDPVFANFTMNICVFNRDAEKSLLLLQKRIELMKKKNIPVDPNPYMAWVYQANEMDKEFRWHVERILLNRIGLEEDIVVPNAAFLFVHLAATFALTGQRDEMYACLDQILQRESALMDVISQLRRAPHFDRFRHEIKFDTLVTAIEKKYDSVKRRCQKLFQGENNIKFDLEYPRNTGKVIKGDEQKTGGRNNK